MNICPLCNGFKKVDFTCSQCRHSLEDTGRIIDYFDDYSAYMEIEDMKKSDGYMSTNSNHECAHLFYCSYCKNGEVRLIKE